MVVSLNWQPYAKAEPLAIQIKNRHTSSPAIFAYFSSQKPLENTLRELQEISFRSCTPLLLSTTISSKKEIEPISHQQINFKGKEILLSLQKINRPGFLAPQKGFDQLIEATNRVSNFTKYESLPEDILKLDISSCFPPHALKIIMKKGENNENCFNSSFRFLHPQMPRQWMSPVQFSRQLESCQRSSLPAPGDIGVLKDFFGAPVHSFVYLTQGWAFTKNGQSSLRLYRLQRIQDLKALYSNGPYLEYYSCR